MRRTGKMRHIGVREENARKQIFPLIATIVTPMELKTGEVLRHHCIDTERKIDQRSHTPRPFAKQHFSTTLNINDVVSGHHGGGWGIRTPEGFHPTRFPSVRHRPLGESSESRRSSLPNSSMLSRFGPGLISQRSW